MSDEKRFLDQSGLKQAFELIKANTKANYVAKVQGKALSTNDFTDELKLKLENLDITGEENVIEVVKVNGVALQPTDKVVNIASADVVTLESISTALGFAPISETAIDGKVSTAKTALEQEIADAKEELQEAIDGAVADVAAINTLQYQIVAELPEILTVTASSTDAEKAAAKTQKETIFLVPASRTDVETTASNIYVEYFIVNGQWEEIGDTHLSLEGFATTDAVETAVAEVKTEVLTTVETEYVKETEFVEKVSESLATEEVIKVIEENIHVMTEAEIIAMFEQAPVVMHADGTYDVLEDGADAIEQAQSGDTVVLVEDVEIDAGTEVADGVVIDLNGHTLTVKA